MSFGLTENGFNAKTLYDSKAEIEAVFKSLFGESFDLSAESPAGQIISSLAEREADIWEMAEDIYNSQYPTTASGVSLDLICSYNGVTRGLSEKSTVEGQVLIGDEGTIIPIGTIFSVPTDETKQYETQSESTLGAGNNEVRRVVLNNIAASGAIRFRIGVELTEEINFDDTETDWANKINNLSAVNECEVTFASTTDISINLGKIEIDTFSVYSNTLQDSSNNSITTTTSQTSIGEYQAQVNCLAVEAKEQTAFSYSLTNVVTPITGLLRVFNPNDSSSGSGIEEDYELRQKRENSLSLGKSTPDAIRAALLRLSNIDNVYVIENESSETDIVGRPPHCFETYVYQDNPVDGDEDTIAETILEYKGAGILAHGDITKSIIDSSGITRNISFSRPSVIDIYLDLELTITSEYPTNGDDALKQQVVEWGNALGAAKSVIVYPELMCALEIAGLFNVSAKIGTAASPTSDQNIIIGDGINSDVEISNWDTSRINITHT